jgi:OOP family OmpA-OmpF porin
VRVPDQVLIITDSSGTMYAHETFPLAKALTQTFVAAMPENSAPAARPGPYSAGLSGFGGDERIVWPLQTFNRAGLANTAASLEVLGELGGFGGPTPYRNVLAESRVALMGKSMAAAVVIFSDGLPDSEARAMLSGKLLVDTYNGNVCIHTVQTGDEPEGAAFLARLSSLTGCGSSRSAASVRDSGAFMAFVRQVFSGVGGPNPCTGVIRLRGVEFEFDSARLVGASSVVLDVAVDALRECPNIPIRVEGHTDSLGSDAYNQNLGLRRAQSVRSHLVRGGIGSSRVTARSWGESRPIATNDTDEGRALNRRVELHPGQ